MSSVHIYNYPIEASSIGTAKNLVKLESNTIKIGRHHIRTTTFPGVGVGERKALYMLVES